jgi:hypothetical protein
VTAWLKLRHSQSALCSASLSLFVIALTAAQRCVTSLGRPVLECLELAFVFLHVGYVSRFSQLNLEISFTKNSGLKAKAFFLIF